MNTTSTLLTAKQFRDMFLTNTLPSGFMVNEPVKLDARFMNDQKLRSQSVISNGEFTQETEFDGFHFYSLNFIGCTFKKKITIQNCIIVNHLTFQPPISINQKLEIWNCNIGQHLVLDGINLTNLSVRKTTFLHAFVSDYKTARLLELSKQCIYLELCQIPDRL